MNNYRIFTDSTADLPESFIKDNNLGIFSLSYTIDDVTYGGTGEDMPVKEFYSRMRNGSMPITSQVNPEVYLEEFTKVFEESDDDILYIAFSSGLSGSYNSSMIAKNELQEKYPDRKLIIIDSLCASLGEGLLVYKSIMLKNAGKTIDENAKWVEENKLNIGHNFTVDDLNHLSRGGRLSKVAAIFGTMASIKPMLIVDKEGHLTVAGKVRGRKKSLISLVDSMENQIGNRRDKNDIVFISHGDCVEDAEFVAGLVKERFGITKFMINDIGPRIGAHAGPGTVALFYESEIR